MKKKSKKKEIRTNRWIAVEFVGSYKRNARIWMGETGLTAFANEPLSRDDWRLLMKMRRSVAEVKVKIIFPPFSVEKRGAAQVIFSSHWEYFQAEWAAGVEPLGAGIPRLLLSVKCKKLTNKEYWETIRRTWWNNKRIRWEIERGHYFLKMASCDMFAKATGFSSGGCNFLDFRNLFLSIS